MLQYIIGIVVIIIFLRYTLWRNKYAKLFPGIKPSLFNVFGDFWEILGVEDRHVGLINLLMRRVKQFQKEKLILIWSCYMPFLIFNKPDTVKELLKSNKMLDKGWMYEWMKPLVGTCLLTSNGETWKSRRRLLNPCFHSDIVRSFITTFNEEARKLVIFLQKETKKDFSEISTILTLGAIDMASETLFGVSIGALENENVQFVKSLRRNKDLFMYRIFSPWLWPDIIFWNTHLGKEFMRNVKLMHKVTKDIIVEKKKRYLRGEQITLKGKRKAVLDLLLEQQIETQEMTDDEIRGEVDLFLISGHETIGITTAWAFLLLGHHPEIQAKVHEELDRVFGDDLERHTTEDDFQHLQYLECVLKETYRLYPGIPIFSRHTPEDMDFCGHIVPKGTTAAVFVYMLHRDPDVFPDPEKFDPDRFSPENIGKIPEYAYIPFSGGSRNCIGYKFAEFELRIMMSWILRHYTVESYDPRDKVIPMMSIGLQPSKPIRIKLRPRSVFKSHRNHQ